MHLGHVAKKQDSMRGIANIWVIRGHHLSVLPGTAKGATASSRHENWSPVGSLHFHTGLSIHTCCQCATASQSSRCSAKRQASFETDTSPEEAEKTEVLICLNACVMGHVKLVEKRRVVRKRKVSVETSSSVTSIISALHSWKKWKSNYSELCFYWRRQEYFIDSKA